MKILYDYQMFLSQKYGGPSRYFIETPSAFKPSDRSVSRTCELIKIGKTKITR